MTAILVVYEAFGLDDNKMRSAWEKGTLDFASNVLQNLPASRDTVPFV